jgi:hypothetical protein
MAGRPVGTFALCRKLKYGALVVPATQRKDLDGFPPCRRCKDGFFHERNRQITPKQEAAKAQHGLAGKWGEVRLFFAAAWCAGCSPRDPWGRASHLTWVFWLTRTASVQFQAVSFHKCKELHDPLTVVKLWVYL